MITMMCSAIDFEKIRMLSIYTMIFRAMIKSQKIMFIIAWKVARELVRLKNITVGSKRPRSVTKEAFHSSPFLMCMLLYPYLMSSLVNTMASFIMSKSSWINGKGQTFWMMCLLR